MPFDPWAAIQRQQAGERQMRENSARMAECTGFIDTDGNGEHEPEDEIHFGVTYIEEPSVSYGHSLDGDQLVDGMFPRCFGGVSRWRRDTRGFYVGAWTYVVVDAPVGAPAYVINHYFGFSGIAMKVLPDDLLAQG